MPDHHVGDKSRLIRHIEYESNRNILTVRFHSGVVYEYPCDNYQMYQDFCDAKSKGSHFHKYIRPLGGKKVS